MLGEMLHGESARFRQADRILFFNLSTEVASDGPTVLSSGKFCPSIQDWVAWPCQSIDFHFVNYLTVFFSMDIYSV